MGKIDFKKEYANLYKPSAKMVAVVDVPSFNYLMINGQVDPNTSEVYAQAIEALFSLFVGLTLKNERPLFVRQ